MIKDRIKGALYGVAVGDALGAPWEGWRPKNIFETFGVVKNMEHFDSSWDLGEFTDDTWLTLATARAYDGDHFTPEKAALAMVIWMRSIGRGIGKLTNIALSNLSSGRADLYNSGRKAIASVGGRSASNGSLMRCIATGLVNKDTTTIIKESTILSEITHADPKCVAACVGYNLIVAGLLDGRDFYKLAAEASDITETIDKETSLVFLGKSQGDPHSYNINDMQGIGYVLRALDRSLVALMEGLVDGGFEKQIIKVANEGGDADTNAAIAGGLLGATFGYDAIPQRWIDPLMNKDEIDEAVELLVKYRKVIK